MIAPDDPAVSRDELRPPGRAGEASRLRAAKVSLSGWGRFGEEPSAVYRPESWRALSDAVASAPEQTLLARGLGRSYGDSALNAGGAVVLTERLGRILDLDEDGLAVTCEGGTSLARLLSFLVPRGFFLPVVPGTRFVTVGGALAADIHGKNHHVDGTIGRHVEELTILTSSGESLRCSHRENAEAFDATIGGMGLTGFILSARLRLLPIETPLMRVVKRRAKDLDELLSRLYEEERLSRYSFAWVDGLARGGSLGRGLLMRGDHVPLAELPPGRSSRGGLSEAAGPSVPFDAPPFAVGPLSVAAFNAVFYAAARSGTAFSGFPGFFFPLDAVGAWNRLYGRRGFIQYQALLPRETAAEGCRRLLEEISRERAASFLAVLKTTGPQGRGLLSFPCPGVILALDVPNVGERLRPLARRLDAIVLKAGGRLHLAKDSLTDAATFAAMYPRLAEFRAARGRLDPRGRFSSTQARRLALLEER
ncbi:MAG TPA: FAD-binding oxidoreductase [Thermoanaerobaculia bacterium]|nr:FAD-binding oxidoreductase [Thermoanaerobaculia bacterium]